MTKRNIVRLFAIMVVFLFLASSFYGQSASVNAQSSGAPDSWPMYRNDLQRTGYSVSTVPDTNAVKWIYNTTVEIDSSPAVADGRLIVGVSNGDVLALNSTTGNKLWNYETGAGQNSIWSSPAIDSGKVYIGTRRLNSLFCLSESDGSLLWTYPTGNDIDSSPAVKDGRVYFNSNDGYFYCLNSTDGLLLWKYQIASSNSTADSFSSPAILDNTVFVGAGDSAFAFNAVTGDVVWSIPTGAVTSAPAVSDGRVFIASSLGVSCVNANSGAVIWNISWSNSTSGGSGFFRSSPTVADNKLFVGSPDGNLYCLDASSGSPNWHYNLAGEIWSSPAVADGKALIGSGDGRIYCFNESTGTIIWSQMTMDRVASGPVISNGIVFVGCGGVGDGGRIYAFGTKYTKLSNLTLEVDSQAAFLGFRVNLNGVLASDEGPIAGAFIIFSYSVNGGRTWIDITSASTDETGSYSAVWDWIPSATGKYLVKASWEGDYPYSSSQETRSLSVSLFNDQYVFSVVSNSTVSALAFNSETHELSFTVTGDAGTTGFVKATIAKSLEPDSANIQVYIDNSTCDYTVSSIQDSWVITFNYHHSTHAVAIDFASAQQTSTPLSNFTPVLSSSEFLGIIVALSVMVAVLAGFILVKGVKGKQKAP